MNLTKQQIVALQAQLIAEFLANNSVTVCRAQKNNKQKNFNINFNPVYRAQKLSDNTQEYACYTA